MKNMLYTLLLRLRQKITFAGIPLHKKEGYAPFFIIGSGRSGNTLLRRILNNHSALYIPPETYVLGRSIRQSLRYPQMSWPDLAGLMYSNFEFHPEFETFEISSLGALYQAVSKVKKHERSIAYLLNAFYEQYRIEHGLTSKRWGDKTPQNTYVLHELHAVFPDAKFIHILRNPYDAIASYVKSGIYSDVESAAKRWRTSVEDVFMFVEKYPESCIEILYDELVTYPMESIERLCVFLEIDYEPGMLSEIGANAMGDVSMRRHHKRVMKPIDTKRIGAGFKELESEDIKRIAKVLVASYHPRIKELANVE